MIFCIEEQYSRLIPGYQHSRSMKKEILLLIILSLSSLAHSDSLVSSTDGQPGNSTGGVGVSTADDNKDTLVEGTTGSSTTKPEELTTSDDGSRVLGINSLRSIFGRIPPLPPIQLVTTTQLPTSERYTTVEADKTTGNNSHQTNVSASPDYVKENSRASLITENNSDDSNASQTKTTFTVTETTERPSHTSTNETAVVTETPSVLPPTKSSITETETQNATGEQNYGYYSVLCGYPAICDRERCSELDKHLDPISECARQGGQEVFGIAIVLMAIMIIAGNSLLPIIVLRNRDMRTHHNIMKVSLAFADMITGFLLLFSALPNMAWTMGSAEFGLVRKIEKSKNSATAVVAGSAITLSALASLGHLMYLSIERFVAIQWPLWHRGRRTRTVALQIGGLWTIAILAAFIPAAFPEDFQYRYNHVMFAYLLTPVGANSVNSTWYLVLVMIVPFSITVFSTLSTGCIVWYRLRTTEHMKTYSSYRKKMDLKVASPTQSSIDSTDYNKNQRCEPSRRNSEKIRLKPEVAVFRTTVLMIVAFSLTILPVIVVLMLYYNEYYNCDTYPLPYTFAVYACMLNSFVNVIIYTIRDRKFRAGLSALVHCKAKNHWGKPPGKNLTVTTNMATCKASTRF